MIKRWIIDQSGLKELYTAMDKSEHLHCPKCGSEDLFLPPCAERTGAQIKQAGCMDCHSTFDVADMNLSLMDQAQLRLEKAVDTLLYGADHSESLNQAKKAETLLKEQLAIQEEPESLKLLITALSIKAMIFEIRKRNKKALEEAEKVFSLACRLVEISPDLESRFLLAIAYYDLGRLQKSSNLQLAEKNIGYSITLLQILLMELENAPFCMEKEEEEKEKELADLINVRLIHEIEGLARDLFEKDQLEEAENWLHALIAQSERYIDLKEDGKRPKRVLWLLRKALELLALIYHKEGESELELTAAKQYLLFSSLDLYDHLCSLDEETLEDYVFIEDWQAIYNQILGYKKLIERMIELVELSEARALLRRMALLMEEEAALKLKEISQEDAVFELLRFELDDNIAQLYLRLNEEKQAEAFYQKAARALEDLPEQRGYEYIVSEAFDACQKLLEQVEQTVPNQPQKRLALLLLAEKLIHNWEQSPFFSSWKDREDHEEVMAILGYENDLKLADVYLELNELEKALDYKQSAYQYLRKEKVQQDMRRYRSHAEESEYDRKLEKKIEQLAGEIEKLKLALKKEPESQS